MKNKQLKERDLDITDLFWKLLEQWRGIVLCGLVLALLLSAAMIVRNRHTSKKTTEVDPEVSNVLSMYSDFITKRENYNDNFFNNVDLNDCMTVTCLYEYNSALIPDRNDNFHDETTLSLLNNLYNIILSDDTFRTEMINELKNYWPKIDSKTLGNIMISSAAHTVVYGPGVITINMVIPKDKDPVELQAELTKSVYAYYDRINANITQENTIRFVSYAFKQTDYTAELNARNSRYNPVSSGLSQYKNAYNNLDKELQRLVDDTISACGSSTDPEVYIKYIENGSDNTKVSTKSLLKKFGILGFVVGVALYAIGYLVLIILVRRVRAEDDAEIAADIRNFGGIYEYPYNNFIRKFIHSKMIYTFRTRSGKDMDRISKDIASKLDFSGKKAYTLITLGKLSERAKALNEDQLKFMNDKGITVRTLDIDKGPSSVEDSVIAGLDSVVIELIGNKTKWMDLIQLYYKLKEYNIDIVGSQLIDA